MNIPANVKYVAKAIAAAATVIVTGAVGGAIDLAPEVVVALQAGLAAAAVFGVTNGPKPE